MKKFIALIIIVAIAVSGGFYRTEISNYSKKIIASISTEEKTPILRKKQLIPRDQTPKKEIEVFTVGQDKPIIFFTKNGISSSSEFAYVMPQISGRIAKVNVKIGDKVTKGETLITLGNSFGTDIAEIQYETAREGYNLAAASQYFTSLSGNQTLQTIRLGIQMAQESYENAINGKENAETILGDQISGARDNIDNLEDSYDDTSDNYDNALTALDELQKNYDELSQILPPDDPNLKKLEEALLQAQIQVSSLKSAKKQLNYSIDQAENGLITLKDTRNSQLDQLDFAITVAFSQFKTALSQLQSAYYGTQLQELGAKAQVLQSESGLKMAGLSIDQQNIAAPIDGIITSLQALEGNLTAPGQILAKIENLQKLLITTSINTDEAKLISPASSVAIIANGQEITGKIFTISPIVNEMTKKIDIEIEIKSTSELIPGEMVEVKFYIQNPQKIFIPINSVFINEEKKYVKIVNKNSRIKYQDIQIGKIVGNYVEVLSGLTKNDKVLRPLTAFIEEGNRVKIVNK